MKRKILILLFLISFLSFWSAKRVLAVDLTVTCAENGPCSLAPFPGAALFSENNFLPGDSVTKQITVVNNDTDEDCYLYLVTENETQSPGGFAEKLFTVIKKGASDIYGVRDGSDQATGDKKLADLFSGSAIFLSTIAKNSSEIFAWTVTFDFTSGNYYQNASMAFNFDLTFSCGFPPVPTPTPVPTSPPGGGGPAGGPGPACTDAKPGLPTGFSAVAGPGTGQVTLSWLPPSLPYTYFLIAYSDSSSWPPKWGNPDVGDVSSFTVSGLGAGTYWFWLRAGNGCMPGDFVGPISPGAIAGVAGGGVAPGFAPGVLGVETPGELGEGEATREGEVMGAPGKPICWWWLILALIGAGLVGAYCWLISKTQKKFSWYFPVGVAVLGYIGDRFFAHRFLAPSHFCNWMWLWSILSAFLPTGLYLYFKRR